MASVKFIRDRARQILEEFKITRPPVPVREIVESFALKVEEISQEDAYDGELIPELRLIRINRYRPNTRQRFTLAHELGHWALYHQQRLYEDEVDLDSDGEEKFPVKGFEEYRDSKGQAEMVFNRATSRSERDTEANVFAAELLMPTKWVRADWKRFKPDVNRLAQLYEVSADAMWIKVMELGLIK